jgi:putative transport protein
VLIGWQLKIDKAAVLGVMAGSTTNTPSLGAAQQSLSSMPGVSPQQANLPALAYAVTYPIGCVGTIITVLILRRLFLIDIDEEIRAHARSQPKIEPPQRRTLVVENANLEGLAIRDVPSLKESGVIVARIRRANAADVGLLHASPTFDLRRPALLRLRVHARYRARTTDQLGDQSREPDLARARRR